MCDATIGTKVERFAVLCRRSVSKLLAEQGSNKLVSKLKELHLHVAQSAASASVLS